MRTATDPILYDEDVVSDATSMFDAVRGRVTSAHEAAVAADKAAVALRREKLQTVCDIINSALTRRVLIEEYYGWSGRIHATMGDWWGDPRLNLVGSPCTNNDRQVEMLYISMRYPNCHCDAERANEVSSYYLYIPSASGDYRSSFATLRELVTFIFEHLTQKVIAGSVKDCTDKGADYRMWKV